MNEVKLAVNTLNTRVTVILEKIEILEATAALSVDVADLQ
jgi:hypothetical protein